jgi:hypothetical protein
MPLTQSLPAQRNHDVISPLISALIIVLFLFFIDEGYYDFRWMKDWGNWIVFGMYSLIFFPIQWIISHYVFGKLTGWVKVACMVLISVPASVLSFWLLF